ncbi:hypothetical protein [Amycolatopsis regifaucium]|nr:hypothetical protein [Amycolatopsis regifaucium]
MTYLAGSPEDFLAVRHMSTRFHLGDGEHGTARHSPEFTFGVTR